MQKPQNKYQSGVFDSEYGLFWMEVVACHEADGALKAQNADVAPSDIAVLAV